MRDMAPLVRRYAETLPTRYLGEVGDALKRERQASEYYETLVPEEQARVDSRRMTEERFAKLNRRLTDTRAASSVCIFPAVATKPDHPSHRALGKSLRNSAISPSEGIPASQV